MSYLEAPRSSKKSIYSRSSSKNFTSKKWLYLGVNHELSCCKKKKIKNRVVANRSGEITICG
jgi:hypothetical protein